MCRAAGKAGGKRRPTGKPVLPALREVTGPLVLLADCAVLYEGRASSTLRRTGAAAPAAFS